MGAAFRDLLTDLYAALRADHTSQSWGTYNLSDDGLQHRVFWDEGQTMPLLVPVVCLGNLQIRPSYANASLGSYQTAGRIEWWGFVAAPDLTPEARMLAAVDLANDVIRSLQAAHFDPAFPFIYQCQRFMITMEDTFGDASEELAGYGMAFGSIEWERVDQGGI